MKKTVLSKIAIVLLASLVSSFGVESRAMETSPETHWNDLPAEIKLHVLSYLQTKTKTLKEFFDYALTDRDFATLITACPLSSVKDYAFSPGTKITVNDIFFEAISKRHYKVIEILLERGVDVNQKDHPMLYANTALIIAAGEGYTEIVELLISNGADIDAHNQGYGDTALLKSAKNGHLETLKVLIAKGANINAQNTNGETALMFAAKYGYTQMVKLLIEQGANAQARSKHYETALILAITNRHEEIIELLIHHLSRPE